MKKIVEKTKSKIKRVGVLRGGAGKHYASSLKKGGEIIFYISENLGDKYKPVDILIDKDYIWHCAGVPINPGDLVNKIDIAWNVAHPSLSNILESLSIPTVGASSFSFTLENERDMMRDHLKNIGIDMPRAISSPKNAREVFDKFGSPWIVKNENEIRIVKTFDELAEMINNSGDLTVEEFIAGKVASVHSMPDFRKDPSAQAGDIYTFPLGSSFGSFSAEEKANLATVVKDLHKHIGAKHYLKSDFVLSPKGQVYLLQINGTPNLKTDSHFFQICESVGAKMHLIIEHMLEQA